MKQAWKKRVQEKNFYKKYMTALLITSMTFLEIIWLLMPRLICDNNAQNTMLENNIFILLSGYYWAVEGLVLFNEKSCFEFCYLN